MSATYSEIRDLLLRSHSGDWDELSDVIEKLLDYTVGLEVRLDALAAAPSTVPEPPTFNHISLRHRDAKAFTTDVTEHLNEGWEFAASPLVAAGGDDRTDLWLAFLRREVTP